MKILYILPYLVVPPNSGNKNLTSNLLQFTTNKASCDLVMLIDSNISYETAVESLRYTYPNLQHLEIFTKPQGWARIIERIKSALICFHPSLGSFMSSELRSWLKVNSNKYDLIHFDMIHTTLYRDSCGDVPTLLVASDAYSMAAWQSVKYSSDWIDLIRLSIEGWLLRNVERRQYRKFDVLCSVSKRDSSYLERQLGTSSVKTIGIGLGEEYSRRVISHFEYASTEKVGILITGSLDQKSIAMNVKKFILQCLPLINQKCPGIQVTLLGKNPHTSLMKLIGSCKNLRHISFVHDYADFLDQDWVYVYTQENATGLQTKLQQAMALGLPVVGYSASFGGLNVTSGEHCYICGSESEVVHYVSTLLVDPQKRIAMGAAASAYVREIFSIERTGSEMISLYSQVIGESLNPHPFFTANKQLS
jgi:glycosyltransferase involved in cell wall biosynthesis